MNVFTDTNANINRKCTINFFFIGYLGVSAALQSSSPYFYTNWPETHKRNMLLFIEPLFHIAHADHTLCTGQHVAGFHRSSLLLNENLPGKSQGV